jgi:uncharacterized membrane protein
VIPPHRALFAALAASQVAYSRLPERWLPLATRGIVGLMLATSSAEAVAARGRRGGGLVALAGALGFATEVVGVATGKPFGHYTYGRGLGPKVGGVPVLAAAAWAMMARPSWVVAGELSRSPVVRVPLAAGALTAWDVFLDPRMVADGYWSWQLDDTSADRSGEAGRRAIGTRAGGLYEGVPASNFLGWFVTAAGVFAVWAALEEEDPGADDRDALALYAWTWIAETFANAALWRRPRVAAAGGLAMGALAAPALLRRLRG